MIHFRNDVKHSGVDVRALESTVRRLLEAVGEAESSLSLTLVNDAAIAKLNEQYRGKAGPTDVLSFPMFDDTTTDPEIEERLLGDVVISIDTAKRQAAEYDAPLQSELYRLVIHGLLHVMGHDHIEPEERAEMEAEERRLADAIGMPWPYDA